MKKISLLLVLFLITIVSKSQTFPADVVRGRIIKNKPLHELSVLDSTSDKRQKSITDVTVSMTLRTPALQLTFTQIEKIDSAWKLTTPILIGYSYIFSYANGVIHRDSSITVENRFFFGGGFNFGVAPDFKNGGQLIGSVPIGAVVGYSRYGAFMGYDIINNKPLLAISLNLLNVPILQNLTRFNIKN